MTPFSIPRQISLVKYRAGFWSGARLTRLTNGLTKKWENLKAANACILLIRSSVGIHPSIKCTAAMEAKITKPVWDLTTPTEQSKPFYLRHGFSNADDL